MRFHLVLSSTNLSKSIFSLRHRCTIFATTSQYHSGCELLQNTPKSLHLKGVRYIRARHSDDKKDHTHEEFRQDEKPDEDAKSSGQTSQQKVDPSTIKKLRIYVLVVAGLSFVSSFIILSQMFTGDRAITEGVSTEDFNKPGIPFTNFIETYLKNGEVKRIIFVPENNRAVAVLHQGAIIDGKPAGSETVVVEYPKNAQQFWADIRKAEGEIGIGLSQGVHIDLYQGMTTFKVIELLVGVVIIAWLGTQYGRLLRRRFLENQAKKGGGGIGSKK